MKLKFQKIREENKHFKRAGRDSISAFWLAQNEKNSLNRTQKATRTVETYRFGLSVSKRKKTLLFENNIRFPNRNKLILFQSIFLSIHSASQNVNKTIGEKRWN